MTGWCRSEASLWPTTSMGLSDMIVQLRAGTAPKTTTKVSQLRKLAMKRSEMWCRTVPGSALVSVPGSAENGKQQVLYGKEALLEILKSTSAAVKKKDIGSLSGPEFLKPFKQWKWLLPETYHVQARQVMGQILVMQGGKGGKRNAEDEHDDLDIAALQVSTDKALSLSMLEPPASSGAASSSASGGKTGKAGGAATPKADFLSFFHGKKKARMA